MKKIISSIFAVWIAKTFIISLFFKFSTAPITVYIFTTIGDWLSLYLGDSFGVFFGQYAAYIIGIQELIISLVLLWAIASYRSKIQSRLFFLGALGSILLMAGAIIFHLVTPLGIELVFEGESDGGSLFYSAVVIVIFSFILLIMNKKEGSLYYRISR
ncbi:hypothetical protein COB57_02915 [Candidatus Peregrinibacteria bacterium]|nr:MAG: hypothetical protein COB57_02915 [Candidatus Peregrinibacteria bacterium]